MAPETLDLDLLRWQIFQIFTLFLGNFGYHPKTVLISLNRAEEPVWEPELDAIVSRTTSNEQSPTGELAWDMFPLLALRKPQSLETNGSGQV